VRQFWKLFAKLNAHSRSFRAAPPAARATNARNRALASLQSYSHPLAPSALNSQPFFPGRER